MSVAENGQMEVCEKLAELGADLHKADNVSETCCNLISVCCCMIVMLIVSFDRGWHDGFDVGCSKRTDRSVF